MFTRIRLIHAHQPHEKVALDLSLCTHQPNSDHFVRTTQNPDTMRMTRAALRAQTQTEEQPQPEHQDYIQKEQGSRSRSRSSAMIHEDPLEFEAGGGPEIDSYTTDASPVRLALRDITDENYPKADLDIEVQLQSLEEQDTQKSTRKSRGKTKSSTKKKAESHTVIEIVADHVEIAQEQEPAEPVVLQDDSTSKQADGQVKAAAQDSQSSAAEADYLASGEKTRVSDPFVEEEPLLEATTETSVSKTPKFDPAVHIPKHEASASEDSFVHSITSRSPAKITEPPAEDIHHSTTSSSSLHTRTPLRRTSSTNFEESFEAMDSLEDTIEQMTADLPLLAVDEMHSLDSPVKVDRRSLNPQTGPVTPNSSAVRTPKTTGSKLQSVLRAQDKENTPSVAKTPLAKSRTPLKSKTPTTKEAAPLRNKTSAAKQPSSVKAVPASARRLSPKTTIKPIAPAAVVKKSVASAQPEKSNGKSVMTANTRPQATARKSIMPLQKKPAPKQPLANTTNIKAEPKQPAALEMKSHQPIMSFSNPPAKPQPNVHQRRLTSGGVLSTSKPAFVPAKSSKPPTISTFALPGEAVAEKLKAQKEAREEKMKQPKLTLAEQKAAKLKADREAREERVRLNQLRAKEVEVEKHKPATARPLNSSTLTISKARADAAERGRQASKEWAEKMMKKKQADAPAVLKNGVTAS